MTCPYLGIGGPQTFTVGNQIRTIGFFAFRIMQPFYRNLFLSGHGGLDRISKRMALESKLGNELVSDCVFACS